MTVTLVSDAVNLYSSSSIKTDVDKGTLNLIKECAIENWMNYGNGLNPFNGGSSGGLLNKNISYKDAAYYSKFGKYPGENSNGFNLVI